MEPQTPNAPDLALTERQEQDPDQAVVDRVRNALRRSFDYGSGLFIVGFLFAALTLLSLRVAVPAYRDYQQRYSTAVKTLFHTTLESHPTESDNAILAVIPAAIAADTEAKSSLANFAAAKAEPLDCSAESNCPATALNNYVELVFGEADRLTLHAQRACEKTESELRKKFEDERECLRAALHSEAAVTEALMGRTRVLEDLAEVVLARLSPGDASEYADNLVTSCEGFSRESLKARTAYLPAPGCNKEEGFGQTTLLIPQQLVPQSPGMRWSPRVAISSIESQLFDEIAARIARSSPGQSATQAKTAEQNESRRLTWPSPIPSAAYFISVDGLLRYWDREGKPTDPPLPQGFSGRIWTQTSYFYPLLTSSASLKKTEIYVDIAGHGLVRTFCYPVTGMHVANYTFTATSGDPIPPPSPTFIGAACIDLSFPDSPALVEKLRDVLSNNPLIDAAVYAVSLDSGGQIDSLQPILHDGGKASPPRGWPAIDLQTILRNGSCHSTSSGTPRAQQPNWSDVKSCDLPSNEALLYVPLYRRPGNQLVALTIRPHAPELPRDLSASLFCALLGIIGMIVCGFGLGGSLTRSELAKQLGRLRSLPVAIVDCNVKDEIVAANDRFEEIVRRKVPKFGVAEWDEDEENVKFSDLFENFMQGFYADTGKPTGDITAENVEVRSVTLDDDLRRTRVAGHRSVYFASVKAGASSPLEAANKLASERRSWLKVIASPVMTEEGLRVFYASAQGRSAQWVPTFGVLIEATVDEASKLNKKFIQLQAISPSPTAVTE